MNVLTAAKQSRLLLGLVAMWKGADVLISLLAPRYIRYLGFFSYKETMYRYGVPVFIRALTNFDGIFYIRIAKHGYLLTEQAYFPFYSVLIFSVSWFMGNALVSALLISHIAFAIALTFLFQYLPFVVKKEKVLWVFAFLFLYPTSYYFGVAYTESLFFMLMMGTFLCMKKRYYWQGAIFAFLASLTKVAGIFLLIPIGITFLSEVVQARPTNWRELVIALFRRWRVGIIGLASLSGLLTYCLYLWKTLHDPLYFIHAQESFGAHRSSKLIAPPQVIYRYFEIFTKAAKTYQYSIAVVEVIFYFMALWLIGIELLHLWQQWRERKTLHADRLGLAAFSLANIIVPSLTGTLTAMPRYSLMSLTIFFVLAEMKNKKIQIFILACFAILHILFFALFIQGYYVT